MTAVTESLKKLEDFKTKCKKEAEILVKDVFPRKVLELNDMLESEKFSLSRLDGIHAEINIPVPDAIILNHDGDEVSQSKKRKHEGVSNDIDIKGTKVLALPNGAVPCNIHIQELIGTVKPQIREVIDYANQIKMWIAYLIPRIEDGNNFGVGVQEDALAEARQVETEAATFLDQISRYYTTRGKIISKVAKYPHVEDYRQSVHESDEKQYLNMRWTILELRNHYSSLHDLITKNLDKIKKPRSLNVDNMY